MSRLLQLGSLGLLVAVIVAATACVAAPAPQAAPVEAPAAAEPAAETPAEESAAPAVEEVAPAAGELADVPRNRTLISQGWDFYNQVPSPTNFNPYGGPTLHMRNNLHYTVYESLFYSNYATGETVPWLGESWEYNEDFTELTVKLREGVTWSDGEPFTADDVVFSINMLKENSPEMLMSSVMEEWVEEATAEDDLTVHITLKKPGPRWAMDILATGQAARFVIVPEHIWQGKDAQAFENFDLEQGWPVGTGPFRMVRSGADSVIFDRRDNWWAVETGLVEQMPAIERVVYVPATVEAMPQLFINNQLDVGRALQVGNLEAAKAQNPNLVSWHESGPVWGAPDGCVYRLVFNSQQPPFDDPEIRQAINYAIDRNQIVQLAYEGSTVPAVAPLSSYEGMLLYAAQLQDLIDQYTSAGPNLDRTAEIMTAKGYTQNADGLWADATGEAFKITIQMQAADPAGPVLAQQLKDAGFDALFEAIQEAAFIDNARSGDFGAHLWVHCGSSYDPWQTLEHYHSKYAVPAGETLSNIRAYSRYQNSELDALLDQMETMVPSPDDPEYMELVRQAMEIYLRDLPDISLAEELHAVTFNSTYWTGYPSAENPYMHPYIPWDGFNIVVNSLQPTQ